MKAGKYIPLLLAAAVAFTACGSQQKENYKEAELNLEKGHYEEALEGFQQAVSDDIKIVESWRGQGIALLKLNRYEEAIQAFETALAQEKGSKGILKDIWLYKATAEYKNGDSQTALASVQSAAELDGDEQCYLFMGKLYLELAQYEEADASFEQVLDKNKSYESYVDIYQIYVQQDMSADGEAYLKEALELKGKEKEDYYQRGRIYFFMGDTDSAKKELMEAVNRKYPDAMLFLGKIYLSDKDIGNARAMYQQYMEMQEENQARGFNGLALCDIAEGNYFSALEQIQKGLEIAEKGDVQELLYNEVVVYEKMLDFDTAKTKMASYMELYPDDVDAQKENQFLQYR
ncbi:MAG: tetratricopeptide repeat protein [Eubacteriales bacterium]|nr:tetratricopeptide repeat protein [Eubacteriales bacterium]